MNDNIEQKRKCRELSEAYASLVADQGKKLVPEDVCEAFVSGWEAALEYERSKIPVIDPDNDHEDDCQSYDGDPCSCK